MALRNIDPDMVSDERGPVGAVGRIALFASLVLGPVLTISFWVILSMDATYPYHNRDTSMGWIELVATLVSALVTLTVVGALRREQHSWIIHSGAAGLWALTTLFFGYSALYDLLVADQPTCLGPDCMYELRVVFWWALGLAHWVSLLAFFAVHHILTARAKRAGNGA